MRRLVAQRPTSSTGGDCLACCHHQPQQANTETGLSLWRHGDRSFAISKPGNHRTPNDVCWGAPSRECEPNAPPCQSREIVKLPKIGPLFGLANRASELSSMHIKGKPTGWSPRLAKTYWPKVDRGLTIVRPRALQNASISCWLRVVVSFASGTFSLKH